MWLRLLKINMLKADMKKTAGMVEMVSTYGKEWRPLLLQLQYLHKWQNEELERTRAEKDGVEDGQPL
jgi:hypothetical protein